MGELKKARKDIVETLELAGIKAIQYNEKRIIPPVAIVVPDEVYLRFPTTAGMKMRQTNIGIAIVVIASHGTGTAQTDELDDMIETVYVALNKYLDITAVTAPGKVKHDGKEYFGSVFTTEYQIKLEGE